MEEIAPKEQSLADLHQAKEITITSPLQGDQAFSGDVATQLHKKTSLDAIIKANGYLRVAYHRFGGAHPNTIRNWVKSDATFSQCLTEINEFKLDLAEMTLEQRMQYSDSLLMFYLSNKGQSRDYMPPALRGQQVVKNEIIVTAPIPKPDPE